MKTYPEIRVWHNNCPSDPTGEKYWKHGEILIIPDSDIDGYILVSKPYDIWVSSMKRYEQHGGPKIDPRIMAFIWKGWESLAWELHDEVEKACFFFYPNSTQAAVDNEMVDLLERMSYVFNLGEREPHLEKKRMWRCGDASPLANYLTPKTYEYPN